MPSGEVPTEQPGLHKATANWDIQSPYKPHVRTSPFLSRPFSVVPSLFPREEPVFEGRRLLLLPTLFGTVSFSFQMDSILKLTM